MPKLKPKLPGSTVTRALDFEPPAGFMALIERHMGQLSDENQARLIQIIHSYYVMVQFEINAADVEIAERHLDAIQKAASAFWQVLNAGCDTEGAREASRHVESEIDNALEGASRSYFLAPALIPDEQVFVLTTDETSADGQGKDQEWIRKEWVEERLRDLSVGQVATTMTAFVEACDKAVRRMSAVRDEQHYQPGESWEDLVKALAFFWLDLGLVVTAAKHSDPHAQHSPFVLFVSDLQSQFPSAYRKHTQSLGALSGKLSKIIPGAKQDWQAVKQQERAGYTSRVSRDR